jgi:FlaA1/EpsC-like NDP-sugar epimerase
VDNPVQGRPTHLGRPYKRLQGILNALPPLFDVVALSSAFAAGYWARRLFPIMPGDDAITQTGGGYSALLPTFLLHMVTLLSVFFFAKLYHQKRASSRIDLYVTIVAAVSVGVTLTGGLSTFLFKNSLFDTDYPRQLVLYVWFFSALFVDHCPNPIAARAGVSDCRCRQWQRRKQRVGYPSYRAP